MKRPAKRDSACFATELASRNGYREGLLSFDLWRWLFAALLLVLGYLSFKPNPAIQGTPGFPKSLAEWFDLYDYWKNFVGFAALGFCGSLAWPEGVRRSQVLLFFLLCGVILFFEAVQIPIPRRYGDPKDVLAGSLGILAAMPVALALRRRILGQPGEGRT